MYGKRIAVSEADITAGLGRIEDAISAIGQDLENLDAEVFLLSSRWDGEAREAYKTAQASWREDIAHMLTIVNSLTTIARTTTDDFTQAEAVNVRAWR
jgi:WXG100 family type VII secretion target